MKLMTKEIERKMKKSPIYSKEGEGVESEILVKYFDPCGAATWLITEGEKQDNGDYLLFGYMTLGYGYEWGYVMLSELEKIKNRWGLGIERDRHVHGTVKQNII